MRSCILFCLCVFVLAIFAASAALSAECVVSPSGKVVCPVPITLAEVKSCDGPLCTVPRLIVPYTVGSNRPIATKPVVVKAKPVRTIVKWTVKRIVRRPGARRFFARARAWRPLRGGCCR